MFFWGFYRESNRKPNQEAVSVEVALDLRGARLRGLHLRLAEAVNLGLSQKKRWSPKEALPPFGETLVFLGGEWGNLFGSSGN